MPQCGTPDKKGKDLRRQAVEEEPNRICARTRVHNRGPAEARACCCNVDVLDQADHYGLEKRDC